MNKITISEEEARGRYNEMLDGIYNLVEIAGHTCSASYALRRVDETAYNLGLDEFLDCEGLEYRDGMYHNINDEGDANE